MFFKNNKQDSIDDMHSLAAEPQLEDTEVEQNKMSKSPMADWFIRLLKGFVIGFGAIMPGLSGGVLAVILGVYDRMMRFLGKISHQFIKNVAYFFPMGIGGILGVVFFAGVIEAAFGTYAALFTALFIGFVAGTFPSIYQTAGKQGRRGSDWTGFVVSALVVFSLMLLGEQTFTQVEPSLLVWLFSGALVALGFVVPGLSPSNFLIYFGLYDKMATGIKSFDLTMLLPFMVGVVICILLSAKVVNYLFDRFYSGMYHFILGLVVGSTLAIFPTVIFPAFTEDNLMSMRLPFISALLISLAMFIIGIVISYFFSKLEEKYSKED